MKLLVLLLALQHTYDPHRIDMKDRMFSYDAKVTKIAGVLIETAKEPSQVTDAELKKMFNTSIAFPLTISFPNSDHGDCVIKSLHTFPRHDWPAPDHNPTHWCVKWEYIDEPAKGAKNK